MRKEYDLRKLKKRAPLAKTAAGAAKIPVSIRLDGSVLAALKSEAETLGIPYQTHVGSVLHQYVTGVLIPIKTMELWKKLNVCG